MVFHCNARPFYDEWNSVDALISADVVRIYTVLAEGIPMI
jgi:hypothetical protein